MPEMKDWNITTTQKIVRAFRIEIEPGNPVSVKGFVSWNMPRHNRRTHPLVANQMMNHYIEVGKSKECAVMPAGIKNYWRNWMPIVGKRMLGLQFSLLWTALRGINHHVRFFATVIGPKKIYQENLYG